MRILLIHNYYQQRGGEELAFENEISILKAGGHDVESVIFKNETSSGFAGKSGAAIFAVYNFISAKKLKKVIRFFKPDVIHIHNMFFVASPSLLFVAGKLRIPVIVTLHNYRLICCNAVLLRDNKVCELCVNKSLPLHGIRYKCYRRSAIQSAWMTGITGVHKLLKTWEHKVTAYIVLTEFARKKLLHSSLGASQEQMVIKPNFVFDPGDGKFPREDFFLFAGRISPEKGIESLIEAFTGLNEYKLMIAGDGPDKDRLQEKYKHNTNIIFAGKINREELLGILKRCKALIVPSLWYEMLPFIIIEAFATGTPVLASKLGSMQEMISDGYNGIHFIAGDISDMRNKIISFAAKADQNYNMYQNARKTYLDKYHPDQHYQSIINIYKGAIERNKVKYE